MSQVPGKKSKFTKAMTAAELMQELRSDPNWMAQADAREHWRLAVSERLRREQEPLIRDLAEAGYLVRSIDDLVNTRDPYPSAIPVLLRHLENTNYDPAIREGIARALTVREAKEFLPELVEAFRRDPDTAVNGPKWAIGNAIEMLFDDRYADQIAELVRDRSHGPARNILVYALGKSRSEAAREAIESLRSDPDRDVASIVDKAVGRWRRRRRQRGPRGRKPPS